MHIGSLLNQKNSHIHRIFTSSMVKRSVTNLL